nr:ribonuclease H-like domain, reverse transcriptase, RNA-dependent DNA polymerase [Tanacetum cinerariifolium]
MTGNKAYLVEYQDFNGGHCQAASTSTVKKVNTARQMVNDIRPRDNLFKSHAPIRRPFNRTTPPKANFTNHKVNNAGNKTVSVVGGNRETAVKASAVKKKEDGIFISQDKYVAEILKKFDFMSVKTASTLIKTKKPLVKDAEDANVDVHLYRSMIGSLMYLTASRPNIIESAFDLEAYSDSDYAGANLDRKSKTGGCQFLGRRLITWQCKKQTIVATSTTKAEYVAAANCYGQLDDLMGEGADYAVNNGRSTDKIKVLNAEVEGVSATGETLSTTTLAVSTNQEAKMDMRKFFKCWFHHRTTNGHQFTMSNRHKELASPKANGFCGPKLDHEDLEQLDEFDLEEMDLFTVHRYYRECRSKGNQESRRRDAGNTGHKARDNGRIPAKQDEPKAMVTIDGE